MKNTKFLLVSLLAVSIPLSAQQFLLLNCYGRPLHLETYLQQGKIVQKATVPIAGSFKMATVPYMIIVQYDKQEKKGGLLFKPEIFKGKNVHLIVSIKDDKPRFKPIKGISKNVERGDIKKARIEYKAWKKKTRVSGKPA